MRPRRRRRAGAAGLGSGPGGSDDSGPAGPERPATDPREVVPMEEPSSKGSGSTWEMPPKMAATASSIAASTVQPEKVAAWIEENPNKKGAATASSGGVPTVHPGKGSAATVSSKQAAAAGGAHPGKGSAATVSSKQGSTVGVAHPGKGSAATVSSKQGSTIGGAHPGKGSATTVSSKQGSTVGGAHPGKGSAATVSSGDKKGAATASSGGVHPGKGSVSSGDKKAATVVRGAPMVHPGKLAGSGSTGDMLQKKAPHFRVPGLSYAAVVASSASTVDMLQKKAAVGSSGEAQMIHPGMVVTSPVSSRRMLQKTVAAVSSRGRPTTLPGKRAVGTGLIEEIPKKKATALSGDSPALGTLEGNTTAQDCEESSAKHSTKKGNTLTSAKIAQKNCTEDEAADMGLSRGMLQKQSSKMEVDTSLSREMLHDYPAEEADTAKDIQDPGKGKAGMGLRQEMRPKNTTALSGEYPALGALDRKTTAPDCEESAAKLSTKMAHTLPSAETPHKHLTEDKADMALSGDSPAFGALEGNTTAQDCEESVAKHSTKKAHTLPSAETPQKHLTDDKADMALSGEMLHKQISKVEADSGLSDEMLHEHLKKQADTAMDLKEAESLIKELNELAIGESISEKESLHYFDNLACQPPRIDLKVKMSREELAKLDHRQALCRLRYYQYKLRQGSQEELSADEFKRILAISEEDCNTEFLKKEGFFRRFEKDETFDWVFHRPYVYCSQLGDYQRLVLKNHGYSRYNEYHKYLNNYEVEQEYVNYCEELSKQLKWMEPYIDTRRSSFKWGEISSRAGLQAIKIAATSFHKITACLAFNAYFECKESMGYDFTWFKEYDGVYFEIWRRVNQGMSFEKALEEVYNLNLFPARQPIMKAALDYVETMVMLKEEFLTCTEDITPDVQEDKAKELIKEAVNNRVQKPKSYEQYIRKKIHIAQIIGIL